MPYLTTKAQAIIIKAVGIPLKVITHVTGISARHIGDLVKKGSREWLACRLGPL